MSSDPAPILVLIGPPGAGKTKVGKRVARALGVGFVDTDKAIVAAHGPIADIFAGQGESAFRVIEREQVASALRTGGIVTLGAGAILDPRTQAELQDLRVCLITVDAESVEERIQGEKRPLLAAGGVAAWKVLVEQRMPVYTRLAARTFDSSGRPMDAVARDVVAWLAEEGAA